MNQLTTQIRASVEHPNRAIWPHAFDADYAIAQCFGAGDQLQSLYNIIQAVHSAQHALREDPDRVPELLGMINQQAVKSYRELMCAVGWVGSDVSDEQM